MSPVIIRCTPHTCLVLPHSALQVSKALLDLKIENTQIREGAEAQVFDHTNRILLCCDRDCAVPVVYLCCDGGLSVHVPVTVTVPVPVPVPVPVAML